MGCARRNPHSHHQRHHKLLLGTGPWMLVTCDIEALNVCVQGESGRENTEVEKGSAIRKGIEPLSYTKIFRR